MTGFTGQNAGQPTGATGFPMGQLAVANNLWNNKDKERAQTKIMEAISQDAIIGEKTNVSVTFGDAEKKELHILGKVHSDRSKERIFEIAQENTPTDVEIHDELTVG